jgi:Ca-activated chloride channel homolog
MQSLMKSVLSLRVSVTLMFLASFVVTLGQSEDGISGIVIDQDGKPIVGALVGVLDQLATGMKDAKTDAAGKFRVTGLTSGSAYRVVVTKYGYSQATLADLKASSQELRVQLKRDEKVLSRPAPGGAPPAEPEAKAPDGEEVPFTLSVAVEEILLNVSVEDSAGRQITDLAKEDFQIFQDGVPQEIKYFGHENVPISVVLLIDISGSMEGSPLVEAKVAALAFLDESRPNDAVSLVAFNDKVEVVRPFTSEMLKVRTGVHSLTSRGGTALYDALSKAVDLTQSAPHPRHVIVLLSDGKDEDSVAKFVAIDKRIQASDVVLFSVGEYAELDRKLFMSGKKYYKPPELDVNLNPVWVLRYFADLSGGRAYFPTLGEPLGPFFSRIARELHQQYVVTYQPTATTGKDHFHTIDVRAKSSRYPSMKVRTRKGYLERNS